MKHFGTLHIKNLKIFNGENWEQTFYKRGRRGMLARNSCHVSFIRKPTGV
jgi:hypothetical protein